MVKAIVFDFDGVLVESVDVKTQAFAELFVKEGPEVVSQVIAYHLRNGGISRYEKFRAIYKNILRRPLSDKHFRRLCDRFANLVVESVIAAPWVEGAREFIENYKTEYSFFIVSATPHEEITEIVRRRQIQHLFVDVFGSPKTKDILLHEVMEKHKLSPRELLYVGDAPNDWAAAQSAGVSFIWRKTPEVATAMRHFTGPAIPSLLTLQACIISLKQLV